MQAQAPYGPPPSYGPPAPAWAPPRQQPQGLIIAVVVLVVFLVMILVFFTVLFGLGSLGDFSMILGPLCIMFFVFIAIAVAAITNAQRRASLPPPPPIQQPMVPAGMQGPVSLECPNCGAPPVNVDRFGVATCTYCSTRFLVR